MIVLLNKNISNVFCFLNPTQHKFKVQTYTKIRLVQSIYIYIYIYISSSCHAASTDIPDPLSPLLAIVHRLWQVFRATSHILKELLYIWAGRPAFARPYVGVHRSTSLMSSSLLLQQYPACLVCLTWIVFVMGSRWPYSWCFVRCCLQEVKSAENRPDIYQNFSHSPMIPALEK